MHNFDFRCIFYSLCVVFCYDHTIDRANIITNYHTMDNFLFFFFFSFLFLLFRRVFRARFHYISLYFKNFIAESTTKYSSSATIYILTSANRLQCPFIHIMLKSRHLFLLLSLSLSGFLLQWHSKSYKNIMKTMFGARCEYRKGKHLVNYKIESHFIMRFASFNTNSSHFDGYLDLVSAFRQPLWSIWLSSQYTIDYWL